MDINEIPKEEKERMDLGNLPKQITMKATNEYFAKETEDKTGGLIINFETRDNKIVTQKYGKVSAKLLVEALNKLKLKDTEELQLSYYQYVLSDMRSGYPRYIPVKKVD